MSYKSLNPCVEHRYGESTRVKNKYPDRIPVICEKYKSFYNSNDHIPDLDKIKYLIPGDLNLGQFMYVIRKRIQLSPTIAIYLYIGDSNILYPTSTSMQKLYDAHKDPDGFLYITYTGENTYG